MVATKRPRIWRSPLLRMVYFLLATAVGINVAFYFVQETLVFPAKKLTPEGARGIAERFPAMREMELTMADGTRLQGWRMPGQGAAILFFGGNGEEVSGSVVELARKTGRPVIGINYRGYGLSQGAPTEAHLFADAVASYDLLASQKLIDPRAVILMGRSLGSGVVIYLAGQRPARALMLVTPYDSITSVAQEHYPFLLVGLILKHRFNSLSRAPALHLPLLAVIAEEDNYIPPPHAMRLVRQYGGPVTVALIPGAGHNDILDKDASWREVKAFLRKL